MKVCILILIAVSLAPSKCLAQNLSDLHWLPGHWIATNNKPGKIRTERWEPAQGTRMRGFGTVTQGMDTTFLEKMHLENKDGHLYFVAEVPENKQPVFFRITKVSAKGFESENPTHDFPKKIIYQAKADTLTVNISGSGKSVEFVFVRK